MSVLVVGLSHRSAPVPVLERASVSGDALVKLLRDVSHSEAVAGTFVVSTCNRVEVYAEVDKFHGGVSAISELLARHSGMAPTELTQHLYVHYEDRAVQHLLAVACGLESMVVGESQILGQVRAALALAREHGTLGRGLEELGSLALRAAKRAHSETGIDQAGANLVSVGVGLALKRLSAVGPDGDGPLAGRAVLVVGAGSMSSLAVATVARLGAGRIVVANRTQSRAERLAASVAGAAARMGDLPAAVAEADLVISCTGAVGLVITAEMVSAALALRETASGLPRPLVLLDLALPRDVEPEAAALPGVSVIGLDSLEGAGHAVAADHAEDVTAVRAIVAEEFEAQVSARHAARVAPTVVALRAKAAGVVESELARLAARLGVMDERALGEIGWAMRRVVDKLLHAPTVRVKELAGSPGGDSYEAALRVLFDLDQDAVDAVTRADAGLVQGGLPEGGLVPPPAAPRTGPAGPAAQEEVAG